MDQRAGMLLRRTGMSPHVGLVRSRPPEGARRPIRWPAATCLGHVVGSDLGDLLRGASRLAGQ